MHRTSLISFVLAGATAFTAAACGSSGDIKGGGDDDGNGTVDAGGRADARTNGPTDPNMPTDPNAAGCRKMDILFVIDNSKSMEQEQANLSDAFPQFAEVLDQFVITTGEHLDYRVAVTTTDRTAFVRAETDRGVRVVSAGSDNGQFERTRTMSQAWIVGSDSAAIKKQQFTTIADVGTAGSGWEMPLDGARMALSMQPANAGFLRDDALLATVFLTDEEDCSRDDLRDKTSFVDITSADTGEAAEKLVCESGGLASPQEFVDFFDKLKGARGRWATAVISSGDTACKKVGVGDAEASPRLMQFVKLTGKNAVWHSICDTELKTALKEALNTFQQACNNIPPVD